MYCTECGTPIAENAKFCTECGHPVQPRPAAPVQETVPAAAETEAPAAPVFAQPAETPAAPVSAQPAETPAAAPVWQQPAAQTAARPPRRYRGRLVLGVISCFLLFLPTGLVSLLQAVRAIRLSDAGSSAEAAKAAKKSTRFFLLSILFNFLWHLLGLFLLIRKYA